MRCGSRVGGVPWTVFAFIAIDLPTFILGPVSGDLSGEALVALALLAALLGFLWRGSRVAWTILTLFEATAVVSQAFDPVAWWAFALNGVGLALLLAPTTRKFVWTARGQSAHVTGPPASPARARDDRV